MSHHLELVNNMLKIKEETIKSGHFLDGYSLKLGSILAVSRNNAPLDACNNEEVLNKVNGVVDQLIDKLKNGEIIYGVNTGYGGSADTVTDKPEVLQTSLLNLLSVGFRGELARDTTRGIVCLRANSAIRGNSGIRLSIIKDLCTLLNRDVVPLLPKRGSVSASGDLIPLAYLAAFLEGKDYAKGSVSQEGKCEKEILSSVEALKAAGLEPQALHAKEVLALVNGTSACAAEASLTLADAHVLMLLAQAITALDVEVMKGTKESFHSFIHESRPHKGQIEVAKNILHILQDSKLCEDFDQNEKGVKPTLRQDRYSLRTTPQWLGPQLETISNAHSVLEIELNSTTDNPIIDPETGKFYHGGNFQATSVAVAMEQVRVAVQHIGKLIYAQHLEVINKDMNKGLPANLAFSPPSLDYGMKGVEISMSSYMAELSYVSNTVTNHVHSTDLNNQNINSVALISARATKKAVELCQMMFSAHIYALLQAVDLRARDGMFFEKLEKCLSIWLREMLSKVILDEKTLVSEKVQALEQKLIKIACLLCQEGQNLDVEARFTKAYNILFSEVFDGLSDLDCKEINLKDLKVYKQRMIESTIEIFNEINEALLRNPTPGDALLGRTLPLYQFFREQKGLKLNKGTNKDISHGESIGKIFETIKNWEMVPALMKCFEGIETNEKVAGV